MKGIWQNWSQNFGYAIRSLTKSPQFSVIVLITLALSMGATTAIYSVIDGVLLRTSPFEQVDRLAMVWQTDRNSSTTREPASVPDFIDFEERTTTFSNIAAFAGSEVNLVPDSGDPTRLAAVRSTYDFLKMVGIRPIAGRWFNEEEDQPGAPEVVLISEGLWERLFSRDPSAIGQSLRLHDVPTEIIGVIPDDAEFGILQILGAAAYSRGFADRVGRVNIDVWLPLQPDPVVYTRHTHPIFTLGRLEDGATIEAAQQEMSAISNSLEETYRDSNDGRGANVEPLTDVVFGPVRPALYVLLSAVVLLLLVACVNVANLLLARGTARSRDVAMRAALGADSRRLAGQFLAEGVVLALAGGILGLIFATWGTQFLLSLAPHDVPRLDNVGINSRVLLASLGVTAIVGMAFGLVPVLQARRLDLNALLRAEGGGSVGAGRTLAGRIRSALVVAQLALAVMLVVGAGLLVKSFWNLTQVDAGFNTAGVLKAEYQLPASRYPVDFAVWPDFREMHDFNDELLLRVSAIPGVESAAIVGNSPVDQGFTNSFSVVGREADGNDWPEISVRRITPDYLNTVGLALNRGRGLEETDSTEAAPVALINQAAVDRFFPEGDAIGAEVNMWGSRRAIVGVIANEKIYGMDQAAPPAIYYPMAQAPSADGAHALLLKTAGDPVALVSSAKRAIEEIDPALAVFGVEPLADSVSRSVGQRRFTMLLLASFALLATVLATVGVHGVLSYTLAQRSREMGVRMALGATRESVFRLVLRQGMMLTIMGIVAGIAAAMALTRVLRSLLFGVSERDLMTLFVVVAVVLIASLVASYLPARRAARLQPVEALRYE
ncbi:MAG TPA: ABC transporter permease [Xanthomonadales bacterium]|nr:ABC transporter permease [Xanthomonadales bacterium]